MKVSAGADVIRAIRASTIHICFCYDKSYNDCYTSQSFASSFQDEQKIIFSGHLDNITRQLLVALIKGFLTSALW